MVVYICWASQVALMVKNMPDNAEDIRDTGSILGSGRTPRGGHGDPLQYACLENPMNRGAWRGYSPWAHKASDMTDLARTHTLYINVSATFPGHPTLSFSLCLHDCSLCLCPANRFISITPF